MRHWKLVIVLSFAVGCGPAARVEVDASSTSTDSPPMAADSPPGAADSPPPADATVYDPVQHVYWLADANLAGDPGMRAALGVSGINDDGTMSYASALEWVAALNAYGGGAGYLGHTDWQLPTNPPEDTSCAIAAGVSGNSFGPGCTASALGQLFSTTFAAAYPDGLGLSVVSVSPLEELPQGLFWTAGVMLSEPTAWDSTSAFTFTFTSGERGRNTTRANYFHVLPVVRGAIGTAPTGTGLVPYTRGPAAGLAIYDTDSGLTWPIDATLATDEHFGVDGTEVLHFQSGADLTVPLVAGTGAMRFESSRDWLAGLNAASYAGASTWELPTVGELRGLHGLLGLADAPERLLTTTLPATAREGFHDFQPFFYWACQRDQEGDSRSPCNGDYPGLAPSGVDRMQWAFNFQSGFQGTDEETKEFFVVPYYPER